MLAVLIIVVVFSALAGTLFWAAPRGKLSGLSTAMFSQTKRARLTVNVSLTVIMLAFGIVIPAYFLINNHNRSATAGTGGIKLTANEVNGRQLFGVHCAVCHTLSSANSVGKIGPNLDQLKPPYQLIMHTLAYGCLQQVTSSTQGNQACLGYGVMPADIVQGQDAVDVARYVAAVEGRSINVAR